MPKQSVPKTTPSLTDEQLQALQTLIPQAFTEGRIDSEKLMASLGDIVDDRPERYSFSWAGKRDAIRLLQVPSRATLIPARDESLDFDTTQNIFIEGDNLEVLKLLYKPYFGRVKMIYIDPPYNTGNDFVYPDNFADPLDTYLQLTGQKDSQGNLLTSNPETGGRYHSAWLSMMYPRLFLARQFLREEGVIFISIDDHEIYNLRLLMNEIYGEENFVGCIVWKNVTDNNPTNVAIEHEYLLVFAKSKCDLDSEWKSSLSDSKKKLFEIGNQLIEKYKDIKELQAAYSLWFKQNKAFLGQLDRYKYIDFGGVYTGSQSVHNPGKEGYRYDVIHPVTGKPCKQPLLGYRFPEETLKQMLHDGKILFGDDETKIIEIKVYAEEFQDKLSSLIELDGRLGAYDLREIFSEAVQIFNNPKPVKLLKSIFSYIIQPNDVVLDFFAGSCTSAQAVLELNREYGGNRHFIMVQLPEPTGNKQFPTIAEIGKERIRRVVARMKKERQGQLALDKPEDLGFKVFKLAASNYWQWEAAQPDAAAYARQAELFADPLVSGWQPENVLYEVALKEGYGLNVTFEPTAVKDVLRVSDPDKGQSFYITLAVRIALEELRPLDLKKDNLFICRDSALDDEAAANLALQCRLKTI